VARESGFDSETFGAADVLFSGVENMPGCCDWES